MTEEEYRNRTPLSDTCWTRCGTKFSCNGDCPNKGERVDMSVPQMEDPLINNRLESRPAVLNESTRIGDRCSATITWHDQMSNEEIDYLNDWFRLQMKKIRRMCKVTE